MLRPPPPWTLSRPARCSVLHRTNQPLSIHLPAVSLPDRSLPSPGAGRSPVHIREAPDCFRQVPAVAIPKDLATSRLADNACCWSGIRTNDGKPCSHIVKQLVRDGGVPVLISEVWYYSHIGCAEDSLRPVVMDVAVELDRPTGKPQVDRLAPEDSFLAAIAKHRKSNGHIAASELRDRIEQHPNASWLFQQSQVDQL